MFYCVLVNGADTEYLFTAKLMPISAVLNAKISAPPSPQKAICFYSLFIYWIRIYFCYGLKPP